MESDHARRPGELVFTLLLTLVSSVALWQSWKISGFSKLSSPGFFPMLTSGTMLLASLFLLKNTVRESCPSHTSALGFFQEILTPRVIVVVVMILLYVVIMPWLGFLLSSALFLFTSFSYLWRKSVLKSLFFSLLSLSIIYVIFRLAFQVVLPQGSLVELSL